MEDLTSVFGDVQPVEAPEEEVVTVEAKTTKGKKSKEFVEKLKTDFISTAEAMAQNGVDMFEQVSCKSDSLEIVNTLGYSDKGGLVVDHDRADSKKDRPLGTVSEIVGYKLRNVGNEPIPYQTEVWAKNETGEYVATPAEYLLQPNEEVSLTRKYVTILCSRIEFSNVLKNGVLITRVSPDSTREDILNSAYLRFNDNRGVHDDTVKIAIADKIDDRWIVKPEFEAAFGFLNNESEAARATRTGGTKKSVSKQAIVANYVRELLKNGN